MQPPNLLISGNIGAKERLYQKLMEIRLLFLSKLLLQKMAKSYQKQLFLTKIDKNYFSKQSKISQLFVT